MSKQRELSMMSMSQQEAVAQMSPALRREFEWICKKEQVLSATDVQGRYEIGERVLRVKHKEATYGDKAVAKLAAAAGRLKEQYWSYAVFAETYTAPRLRKLLSLVLPGGGRLCWTHFRALIRASEKRRKQLEDRILKRKMNGEELMRVLSQKPSAGARVGKKPKAPASPAAGLSQIVVRIEDFQRRKAIWDQFIFSALDEADPGDVTTDLLDQLRTTQKAQADLQELLQEMQGQVTKAIQQVTTLLAAQTEEPGDEAGEDEREVSSPPPRLAPRSSGNGRTTKNRLARQPSNA